MEGRKADAIPPQVEILEADAVASAAEECEVVCATSFVDDHDSDFDEGIWQLILIIAKSFAFSILDPAAFFAAKSEYLLGHEMLNKIKEGEKKKSCLIVSFGEYSKSKWLPCLTLFYRYII